MKRYLIYNADPFVLKYASTREIVGNGEILIDASDWPDEVYHNKLKEHIIANSMEMARNQRRITTPKRNTPVTVQQDDISNAHDFTILSEEVRNQIKKASGRKLIDLLKEHMSVEVCCDSAAENLINKSIRAGKL